MFILTDTHKCAACEYWKCERYMARVNWIVLCPEDAKGVCTGPNTLLNGKKVLCTNRIGEDICFKLRHCLQG